MIRGELVSVCIRDVRCTPNDMADLAYDFEITCKVTKERDWPKVESGGCLLEAGLPFAHSLLLSMLVQLPREKPLLTITHRAS